MDAAPDSQSQYLRLIRDSVGAVAPRGGDARRVRALRFQSPGFDWDVWRRMCELGWPALRLSEERGGLGLGLEAFCAIAEELGAALAPEPFLACGALVPALPRSIADQVVAGELLVVAATLEGRDSVDSEPATTLEEGVVNGAKKFVPLASVADMFLVTARQGLSLVRRDARGVRVDEYCTVDGGFAGDVTFANALGESVAGDLAELSEEATLATAHYLFGAMQRAFEITLEYVKTRKQFGQTIGSFQAIRHRFVDLKIQLELARAVLAEAVRLVDASAGRALRSATVSRAWARTSEAAMTVARESVQFHGAIGYTDACDIGLYVRKTLALANAHGSPDERRRRFLASQREASQTASDEASVTLASEGDDYNEWSDEAFRRHVRDWIEANYPESLPRHPTYRPRQAATKVWHDRLAARGWLAPAWPKAVGGMGLSTAKRIVMMQEFDRFGCARFSDQGVNTVGPMLLHFGSDEQRREFLPKILTGEYIFAQGYSEPGSGSDLASLRTEALFDGEAWILNGQKTWTSFATDANWLHVLARTEKTAKRQDGISVFLVPTGAPGVTVREFDNLAMHGEFCDVFFDNVRLEPSWLVGEAGGGWAIARALLEFERIFFGSVAQSAKALDRLETLIAKFGLGSDAVMLDKLARLRADLADHASLYEVHLDQARRGETLGPEVSMLKIHQTELYKRICQVALDISGGYAARVGGAEETDGVDSAAMWLQALPSTIYSGSSEIQREIVSRQVLRL